MAGDEDFLTVEEVAARLKINPQTVRRWIRKGLLPASRLGARQWRIRAEDLELRMVASTPNAVEQRVAAIDAILSLREKLRGRGIRIADLMAESRAELERRNAARRR